MGRENDERLQFRCPAVLRRRAEQAARDCDMTLGTWAKAVIEGACELHERRQEEPYPDASDPEYEEKLHEAARAERQHLTEQRDRAVAAMRKPRERVRQAECMHPLSARRGPVCSAAAGGCGLQIGRLLNYGPR